jgi:transcription elongation factor
MREVQVAGTQGPSLPKKDCTHPLIGQRVRVTRGNFKGHYGLVKDVNISDVTIEIETKLVGTNAPHEHIPLKNLMVTYVQFWFL